MVLACAKLLFLKQAEDFGNPALMQLFVEFSFVAAVGGVGLEDVSVTGFQLFQNCGFLDYARTTVIGEASEKKAVLAVLGVEGAEFAQVFTQKRVSLFLGELYASAIWLSRLDLMPVANIRPVFGLMKRLKLFYDYHSSLKRR